MASLSLSLSLIICVAITVQTSGASTAAANAFIPGQRTAAASFSSSHGSSAKGKSRRPAFLPATGKNEDEAERVSTDSTAADTSKKTGGTWNPFSLAVLKLGLTEPAWTSPLNYEKSAGTYRCAACAAPLFPSSAKFDSGSGWPSFWKTAEADQVEFSREWDGRIEAKCATCQGHLGHVFPDGPTRGSLAARELDTVPASDPQIGSNAKGADAGGKGAGSSRMPRFCINGVALVFEEENP